MRKMNYVFLMLIFVLIGCQPKSTDSIISNLDSISTTQTLPVPSEEYDEYGDSLDYDYSTYFIVVADTANDYFVLHRKMFELNRQWQIPIDTMGRFFNVSKNLIALPDDDEDEIYAGDYFPRRFPSEHLSIEYMDFYRGHSGDKMMALISGIYESEKSADSALYVLRKSAPNAFKISSEVYIGCMH